MTRLSGAQSLSADVSMQGWSLSFVTQYDVELVQKIEGLTGHLLVEYEMPETDVLKGITRYYCSLQHPCWV